MVRPAIQQILRVQRSPESSTAGYSSPASAIQIVAPISDVNGLVLLCTQGFQNMKQSEGVRLVRSAVHQEQGVIQQMADSRIPNLKVAELLSLI